MFTITDTKTGETTTRDSLPAHIPISSAPAAVIIAAANALGDPSRVKSEADIPKVLEETLASAPAPSMDAAPQDRGDIKEAALHRWYLEAVARYGTGQIEDLTDDELRDLVCVIPKKVVPFERWKEMRGV